MADLSPVAPRLAVLIPRLGSGSDAERVASIHAIQKMLEHIGADFHDLAAALAVRSEYPGPVEDEADAVDLSSLTAADMVGYLIHHARRLSQVERDFVAVLFGRHRRGADLALSAKQEAWLRTIFDRVAFGGAA